MPSDATTWPRNLCRHWASTGYKDFLTRNSLTVPANIVYGLVCGEYTTTASADSDICNIYSGLVTALMKSRSYRNCGKPWKRLKVLLRILRLFGVGCRDRPSTFIRRNFKISMQGEKHQIHSFGDNLYKEQTSWYRPCVSFVWLKIWFWPTFVSTKPKTSVYQRCYVAEYVFRNVYGCAVVEDAKSMLSEQGTHTKI